MFIASLNNFHTLYYIALHACCIYIYDSHLLCMNMKHKLLFHELMNTHGKMSSFSRSEPFKLNSTIFIVMYSSLIKLCIYLSIHLVDQKSKHRMAINISCWIETHR